ncbi:hypothetical protein J2N86_02110 [Legionella lytica]|uniref:Cupin domain protein n=1 Tax=Legionella lytica TaxID=96232 RepID=A0ABY4Y9J5_9GAMM|nr:hypothetical protein [Legionella lytica]USQ14149.1 hypothetical protein J2N86_02110 [Legionella lytica]
MRQFTALIFMLISFLAQANSTQRIPLLANNKVQVWKTLIYPNKEQSLAMHRHEHNRVLVALNSGKLKVTNNKGEVHYLELEKGQAYYLLKDVPGELHTDENMGEHPIKVIVVELK